MDPVSDALCVGAPGRRSTRTEFVPGRIVLCWSPATTSTSSGGSTVRFVVAVAATEAEVASGVADFASRAARCFGFAGVGRLGLEWGWLDRSSGGWRNVRRLVRVGFLLILEPEFAVGVDGQTQHSQ